MKKIQLFNRIHADLWEIINNNEKETRKQEYEYKVQLYNELLKDVPELKHRIHLNV